MIYQFEEERKTLARVFLLALLDARTERTAPRCMQDDGSERGGRPSGRPPAGGPFPPVLPSGPSAPGTSTCPGVKPAHQVDLVMRIKSQPVYGIEHLVQTALLLLEAKGNSAKPRHFTELTRLILADGQGSTTAADKRRIAELWELFGDEVSALSWWKKAAEAGDEDAKDYLEVLLEEMEEVASDSCFEESTRVQLSDREGLSKRWVRVRQRLEEKHDSVDDEVLKKFFADVEEFLSNPDQVADGRRSC